MQHSLFPSKKYELFSLSSGSCGNCYYLGCPHGGILIDAGLGPRVIKKRLAEHGVDLTRIQAVFITHDHYDHIKSVGYLGGKLHKPIYATQEVHRGISHSRLISPDLDNGSRKTIEKDVPHNIDEFTITAFDVPHDSMDNVGYSIEFENYRLVLVTDAGCITEKMSLYLNRATHLIIESNYDEDMLARSSYPFPLKQRISSETGHLSNRQTAEYLANNFSSEWKAICLCHLSGDNNHPNRAYETTEKALKIKGIEAGKDIDLHIFKRNVLSSKIIF